MVISYFSSDFLVISLCAEFESKNIIIFINIFLKTDLK